MKSFKEFLNEFEIEGEHQEGKRYNGDVKQIFEQFESDMISQFGIRDIIDGEDKDPHDTWRHSEFGKGDNAIFCSYVLNYKDLSELWVTVNHNPTEKSLQIITDKLKNISLDMYITDSVIEGESPDRFYRTNLVIPVEVKI